MESTLLIVIRTYLTEPTSNPHDHENLDQEEHRQSNQRLR